MSSKKEEMKKRMMAEAEAAIERLAEQASANEAVTLSEIERMVLAAGQEVQRRLTETMIEVQKETREETECPECGQRMRYKGRKKKRVVAETGEVELERAYYYCEGCRKGIFPPGQTMGLE